MRKTTIRNLIHFILIMIPVFMLFICVLQPLKNADGGDITTDTHTETIVEYYQTNEVNSVDDLIVGNVYAMDLYQINTNTYLRTNYDFECLGYKLYINQTVLDEARTLLVYNDKITCYVNINNSEDIVVYYGDVQEELYFSNIYTMDYNNNSYFWVILSSDMLNNVMFEESIADGFIYNNEPLPQVLKSVSQTTIEGTRYNYDLIRPFETFYELEINEWYNNVLNIIGLENNSRISNYIFHYPLYLMWFFVFELIEIVLTAVPKLLLQICKKIGGEEV